MDFNGSGYISEEHFLKSRMIYKLPFSQEEIKDFFKKEKYFKPISDGVAGMDYEFFKKTFFAFRDSTAGQAEIQEKMEQ
jgi:translation elongation factor EF-4